VVAKAPDADEIERIIRQVDIHAPVRTETEPEPVPEPTVIEERPHIVLPPPAEPVIEDQEVPIIKEKAKQAKDEEKRVKPTTIKEPVPVVPSKHPAARAQPVTVPLVEEKPVEQKGFFGRIAEAITTRKITTDEFENMFWELEVVLLENNVAVEVIEKIKQDLRITLVDTPLPRGKVEARIIETLRSSLKEILSIEKVDLVERAKQKTPFVIAFVGVNGSGKTTTIAKIAHMFLHHNMSVVLAAGDTFRAAAIDQLETHAKKLGVKIVKHDYGADPAAVAFDAIKHAQAKGVDVVLIDTAGRLHSNVNLVDEMKKIIRVAKPDMKIFVGESITGNDCVEQALQFNEAIGIDGIILSKADVDEKGGAAISVSYITKKPILYLGMGQEYQDIVPFDGEQILNSLGLNA
ncbi:MAG: signal recognition particle-docking protein FtsY, partial [Nanoarchaeota archaeon]